MFVKADREPCAWLSAMVVNSGMAFYTSAKSHQFLPLNTVFHFVFNRLLVTLYVYSNELTAQL
jgi:hypothetical protein